MDNQTVIQTDNCKIKKGLYVSLACSQCRTNHRRCNGESPCSRCTKLNLQCIYTQTKPRGGYRGKKNQNSNKQAEYTEGNANAGIRTFQSSFVPEPVMDLNTLLNFYSDAYYQTVEFQLCPFRLPNPDCLYSPDQKFRVLSSIGYAALTLGHLTQGHTFMDQAKQFLPQAMSSSTLESAVGFYHLGLCHLMESDNTVGINYLTVCKTLSSTVYNKQASENRADLFVTGSYESTPVPQSAALKMRYYHANITIATSFKSLQKKLDKLTRFTEKWNFPLWNLLLEMAKTTINLRFCTTEDEVLTAIESIENLATILNSSIKCFPPLYLHMFRVIKFAFLRNYSAMNEECDQFINMFKSLQKHDHLIIKITFLWPHLFRLFNIPNTKIQELMAHIQHLSVSYPGYRAVCSMGLKPTRDPLELLLQRRLTCSEESLMSTNGDPEFVFEDLPIVFEDCFDFDEPLEVSF